MEKFRELFEAKGAVDPKKYAGKNVRVYYPVKNGVESGYIDKDTSDKIQIWKDFKGNKNQNQMSKEYFTEVYLTQEEARKARGM